MKRIRQWVDRLSVKKKLVLYGYLTITPVVLVICLILTATNYQKVRDERLEAERVAVHTLAESWDMQQTDIKDFSTYICINQQIRELLTAADPEEKNKNARLWMDEAPMEIVQDMIALKGYITAIAIYPENGVRPYLRGIDGSVNDASEKELKERNILDYLWHFTHFIESGAVRIGVTRYTDAIEVTAFEKQGKIVVVMLNRTEHTIPAYLRIGDACVRVDAQPKSIATGVAQYAK